MYSPADATHRSPGHSSTSRFCGLPPLTSPTHHHEHATNEELLDRSLPPFMHTQLERKRVPEATMSVLKGSAPHASWRHLNTASSTQKPVRKAVVHAEWPWPAPLQQTQMPWSAAADGACMRGVDGHDFATSSAPAALRTADSSRASASLQRFAYVLGAEGCSAAQRSTHLQATAGQVESPGTLASMLVPLAELQRVARSADGSVALLTACAQAQALLGASDSCLLIWRRPSDERPTLLRPVEPSTTATASRTVCSALWAHPDSMQLLARAAIDRHMLSIWREETVSVVPAAGETGQAGPKQGMLELSGLAQAAVLLRSLAVPMPLPPPYGPALLLVASGADQQSAAQILRAPSFGVDDENIAQTLALAAAAVFAHASSPPLPSPRGPSSLNLPPPPQPMAMQFEVIAQRLGTGKGVRGSHHSSPSSALPSQRGGASAHDHPSFRPQGAAKGADHNVDRSDGVSSSGAAPQIARAAQTALDDHTAVLRPPPPPQPPPSRDETPESRDDSPSATPRRERSFKKYIIADPTKQTRATQTDVAETRATPLDALGPPDLFSSVRQLGEKHRLAGCFHKSPAWMRAHSTFTRAADASQSPRTQVSAAFGARASPNSTLIARKSSGGASGGDVVASEHPSEMKLQASLAPLLAELAGVVTAVQKQQASTQQNSEDPEAIVDAFLESWVGRVRSQAIDALCGPSIANGHGAPSASPQMARPPRQADLAATFR